MSSIIGHFFKYAGALSSDQTFTSPGTYTFTVPEGVYTIHGVAIGAGSSGANARDGSGYANGGTGGALRYFNNLPVKPFDTFTITVGTPGASNATPGTGINVGGDTVITGLAGTYASTEIIRAGGGPTAGASGTASAVATGTTVGTGAGGCTIGGGDGGGSGKINSTSATTANGGAGGGGGAGGYSGAGGAGGYIYDLNNNNSPTTVAAVGGAGGAGGGGGAQRGRNSGNLNANCYTPCKGAGGGGTGLYGITGNGAAGSTGSTSGSASGGGGGGSGGVNGTNGLGVTSLNASNTVVPTGGAYGGGGGAVLNSSTSSEVSGAGQSGAVRIMWGPGRSFPNNAT